jgi:membrane fusion protein, heavy metal efflux system
MKYLSILGGLLLCTLLSCRHEHTTSTEKTEELHPLAYTIYTDKLELFVEFKPLVVAQTSRFAAHITVLDTLFRPLTAGRVTVSLSANGSGSVDSASSPGVFRPELKPTTAGNGYRLQFDIVTPTWSEQLVIDSVTVHASVKDALAAQEPEAPSTDITYLKEQAWKIPFANMEAKSAPFASVIKASGQIVAAPGDEAVVSAIGTGTVHFNTANVVQGTFIRAGTPLFTIRSSGLAEGNVDVQAQTARIELEQARSDYERASTLIKDQIISRKEYAAASARYESATAVYNSLRRVHTAGGARISAPLSGYLTGVMVTEGQAVQTGQTLATLSRNQRLVLRADVPARYYERLAHVRDINFRTADGRLIVGAAVNARLLAFGRSAVAGSSTIPVQFSIDNTGGLLPGSVVEVYLKSSGEEYALAIPVTALIEEQGTYYVYVQTAGESFQKRAVTTGETDGLQIIIHSGIQPGERVVTKGAFQIKLATASGAIPAHGHEH